MADEEDPRPKAALAACASGDAQKGANILAELYVETREAAFVFNQGRCFQQNGDLSRARERFAEYLRVGVSEPAEDRQRAETFIKEIDARLEQQRAAQVVQQTPAAQPDDGARQRTYRTMGFVLAGLGVAAVATGVYLGIQVKSTEHQIEQQFVPDPYGADPVQVSKLESKGTRFETWQFVSYGVGVAALAGAATTFALSGVFSRAPETAQPARGPSVSWAPLAAPGVSGAQLQMRF